MHGSVLFWVLGSGQQVPVFEGVVCTVRGRRSDELDFLLRRVEQAFTLKDQVGERSNCQAEVSSKDLLLTRYYVKVKLRNYW